MRSLFAALAASGSALAVPAADAVEAPADPLWTVLGLGAALAVAYGVTRAVAGPLLKRFDGEEEPHPALRESAALHAGAEALDSGVLVADPGHRILFANRALRRLAPDRILPGRPGELRVGPVRLDALARRAEVDGQAVEMTVTEFRLLAHLMEHAGQVRTRADLLREVWGHRSPVYSRTVDTHVQRLRDKLGPARDRLETVRGVGYRMRGD